MIIHAPTFTKSLLKTVAAVTATLSIALSVSACGNAEGSKNAANAGASNGTLVVDADMNIVTLDPARSFETATLPVLRAAYQTALKFEKNDLTKPQPEVCTYSMSSDNKTVTLTLNGDHYFADGNKVTVDDIVFSYQRLQGIKGNPSFYLDGVKIAKVDDKSLTLTSEDPNPAIPYILPSANLGILEKSVLEQHGGTTDSNDKAESFLNKTSAGSGPYQLDSVAMNSQITLKRNAKFKGDKPRYDAIKMENVDATTAATNVRSGNTDIALNIGSDEAKSMKDQTQVLTGPSGNTRFIYFNANPTYGKTAADPNFWKAVRHALNYPKYAAVYGADSKQAYGLLPSAFLGALTSSKDDAYDVYQAKKELAKSSYDGSPIEFTYSSDNDQATQVAQLFQADLKAIGVTVKLVGKAGTARLDAERSGKTQSGLSMWGADYPDPSDYFVFTPDGSMAQRYGWLTSAGVAESNVDGAKASDSAESVVPYVEKAKQAVSDNDRAKAWQNLQNAMNQYSPVIPIVNDAGLIAAGKNVTGIYYDTVNGVDFTALT
ncbi:ABC transporter substrate-binding protein [Bifidobacterium adolescentis]|uniref:ABC transporter substrate-binding protein n=1 Tax=Bifidobacterium adolescentis TaxID=1680 RepID=UPI003D06D8E1